MLGGEVTKTITSLGYILIIIIIHSIVKSISEGMGNNEIGGKIMERVKKETLAIYGNNYNNVVAIKGAFGMLTRSL